MDMYPDFDLPTELICQPQPLIAFVGLDIQNNAFHKTTWELFSVNRNQDRPLIKFVLFPPEFTLPISKPKRPSYEWYAPKGLIKTNWMNKHLLHIPSVIVFFFELDWDDSRWSEKKLECASYIRSLSSAVGERNTKIAVVLIQRNTFNVDVITEENLYTEKASELCSTCDINPKMLLLLQAQVEHLQGFIIRLENAFNDLAQNYYSQEIRSIKLHKEQLIRNAHQYLLVRHQFKLGFFSEMKHDPTIALKHYILANSNLLEVRITDSNLQEIKTIASFITYKLCRVYFTLNQPRDAISQFNTHVDRFRAKSGPHELIFEHYAWLSKQFQVFADLFEEATRQGLPAVQTRHPGFYYEQAAQYALQRKNLVKDLYKEITQYPENDPLVGWDRVEYYGQRPWRLNNRTDQIDLIKEQAAVYALHYREKYVVNHSAFIISYLGSAISQFKQYRSPRKRRYLAVQMAEEYCCCNDHGKALTLFTHMLWEYRNDKWWELTIDLTKKALICAYLTACLQEYVDRSIEAAYLFSDEEKLRIMNNIQSVIRKTHPAPEPNISEVHIAAAYEAWSKVIQQTSIKCINVDMYSVTSFILCKASFGEANCDSVELEIWLMNDFPSTLSFTALVVGISGSGECIDITIFEESENKSDVLEINPKEIKRIPFTFVPSVSDIGHEIQLKYVLLTMGSKLNGDRVINLRLSGKCDESDILERKDSSNVFNGLSTKSGSAFVKLESKLTAQIKPKSSKLELDIKHAPPILLCEWYPIDIVVKNGESTAVRNCELSIVVLPPETDIVLGTPSFETPAVKNTGEIFETINGTPHQLPCVFHLNDIEINETFVKRLYFRSNSVDIINLIFQVQYTVSNVAGKEITLVKEGGINLNCVSVFEVTASFLSTKCEHISKIYAKMPVLMRMQVDCVSPWPVYVENTGFKLHSENMSWKEEDCLSYLKNRVLKNKEEGAEVVSFSMKNESPNEESLGVFLIYWRREDQDSSSVVCNEVQLPQMKVDSISLFIDAEISSPGWLRSPLSLSLKLQNNSQELLSFDLNMDHTEGEYFMFSGCKKMNFNIAPGAEDVIRFNLFPLHAGHLPLPSIKLTVHSDLISQSDLNDLMKRTLPQSLFVMPQKKSSSIKSRGTIPAVAL